MRDVNAVSKSQFNFPHQACFEVQELLDAIASPECIAHEDSALHSELANTDLRKSSLIC